MRVNPPFHVLDACAFFYPSVMDYSEFKGLQALLFFGIPVVWCIWQLVALRRSVRADLSGPDS